MKYNYDPARNVMTEMEEFSLREFLNKIIAFFKFLVIPFIIGLLNLFNPLRLMREYNELSGICKRKV